MLTKNKAFDRVEIKLGGVTQIIQSPYITQKSYDKKKRKVGGMKKIIERWKDNKGNECKMYKINSNNFIISTNYEMCEVQYEVDLSDLRSTSTKFYDFIETALFYKGDTFIEKCRDRYPIPDLSKLFNFISESAHEEIRASLLIERDDFIQSQFDLEDETKWLNKDQFETWVATHVSNYWGEI